MKNAIYAAVIVVCILVAVLVFVKTRGGSAGGVQSIDESEQIWVKCRQCGQSYQMGKKQYYEELEEKARANPTPMMITPLLTCQKCGKDGIMKAHKCEKCGEVFFENSVPNDFADRCPKCKHSETEAIRKARLNQ
jgi:predicted Zn-ribbon and HTH transcriptional regulator